MKRPEISDRLTAGAALREDRDAIEAQIAKLEYERQQIEVWLERAHPSTYAARERLDAISNELAALEVALDVDPERPHRPQVI
jgi:hypothetical protein